jgi:hypothetical protein
MHTEVFVREDTQKHVYERFPSLFFTLQNFAKPSALTMLLKGTLSFAK